MYLLLSIIFPDPSIPQRQDYLTSVFSHAARIIKTHLFNKSYLFSTLSLYFRIRQKYG